MGKRYEDWQVKQADTALRLYNYFLSHQAKTFGQEQAGSPSEWKTIEEKMREVIRLKQRSYSTEKTYLTWLRSFKGFVQSKKPSELEASDLQDFLSYLAVEKKISSSTQNQALNAIVFLFR